MDVVGNSVFGATMDRPRVRRRFGPSMLVGGVLFATLLATTTWFVSHTPERVLRVQVSKLTVSSVAMAPFQDFIPVRGKVEPLSTVALDAVQSGRVEEVLAEAGQKVVAGQPLIRLSEASSKLEAIAR